MAGKKPKTYNVCTATKYVKKSLPVNYKTKAKTMGYAIIMRLIGAGWAAEVEPYVYGVKDGVSITQEMLDSLIVEMSKEPRFKVRSRVK